MTEEDIRRGQRWAAFYAEEGGLRDILTAIGATYIERMSSVEPWETDKLAKLAMANKITKQIDVFVQEIIGTGKVAQAAQRHAEKIEQIPERKRRLLGLGG
tara:strand:- start:10401 stop:10703 length:303 start_codon:yes stop_codon:yes gene_type:complete